jgi:hypothetical protein
VASITPSLSSSVSTEFVVPSRSQSPSGVLVGPPPVPPPLDSLAAVMSGDRRGLVALPNFLPSTRSWKRV